MKTLTLLLALLPGISTAAAVAGGPPTNVKIVGVDGATGSLPVTLSGAATSSLSSGLASWATVYGSITNTCYMQAMTSTVTGNGWIDCRNATGMTWTVRVAAANDLSSYAPGVTLLQQSSDSFASDLPNTNVQPNWDNILSPNPIFTQTGKTYRLDGLPASLRLVWMAPPIAVGPTVTIMYRLDMGQGKPANEPGPTPPMHFPKQ